MSEFLYFRISCRRAAERGTEVASQDSMTPEKNFGLQITLRILSSECYQTVNKIRK
jgi:hypothetical protein